MLNHLAWFQLKVWVPDPTKWKGPKYPYSPHLFHCFCYRYSLTPLNLYHWFKIHISWIGLYHFTSVIPNNFFTLLEFLKTIYIRLFSLNANKVFLLFTDNAANSIFIWRYGYGPNRKLNVIASAAVKTGLPIASRTVLDYDVNDHISQMENPLLNSTGKLKIYWYGYYASVCESTGSRCTFSLVGSWIYPSG